MNPFQFFCKKYKTSSVRCFVSLSNINLFKDDSFYSENLIFCFIAIYSFYIDLGIQKAKKMGKTIKMHKKP